MPCELALPPQDLRADRLVSCASDSAPVLTNSGSLAARSVCCSGRSNGPHLRHDSLRLPEAATCAGGCCVMSDSESSHLIALARLVTPVIRRRLAFMMPVVVRRLPQQTCEQRKGWQCNGLEEFSAILVSQSSNITACLVGRSQTSLAASMFCRATCSLRRLRRPRSHDEQRS